MSLQRAHLHPQNPLALRRQRLDNIPLQPPQHQRLKLLMQLLDLLLMVHIIQIKLIRQRN